MGVITKAFGGGKKKESAPLPLPTVTKKVDLDLGDEAKKRADARRRAGRGNSLGSTKGFAEESTAAPGIRRATLLGE